MFRVTCVSIFSLSCLWSLSVSAQPGKAVYIELNRWTDMQNILNDTTIVVIPLGAQAKEHGPHLQLDNDWRIAQYLRDRIALEQRVAIYPIVNYSFYPSFIEYAGSTSLRFETTYSMIVDICRIISSHGPKKFYILNTGVSTLAPLKVAKGILATQGIRMEYTDILHVAADAEQRVKKQPAGTHADEIETSMMLYIAPETVNMDAAARDIPLNDGPGPLTLDSTNRFGRYSPTGIYGDATLATKAKGEIVVEAMVAGINKEINALRSAMVPVAAPVNSTFLFTGTFRLSKDEKVIISVDNNTLMFEGKGPRKIPLLRQSDTSFTLGERGRIVFFRGTSGEYSTVYLNWEGIDYLGRK
jgi:creatinine amidohydrolase